MKSLAKIGLIPQLSTITDHNEISTEADLGFMKLASPFISSPEIGSLEVALAMAEAGCLATLPGDEASTIKEIFDLKIAQKQAICFIHAGQAISILRSRMTKAYKAGGRIFWVDAEHPHQTLMESLVKGVKQEFADIKVIVGTATTGSAVEYLASIGADAVVAGINPLLDQEMSGYVLDELKLLVKCVDAADRASIPLIARIPTDSFGEVVKILAFGADAVVLGEGTALGNAWEVSNLEEAASIRTILDAAKSTLKKSMFMSGARSMSDFFLHSKFSFGLRSPTGG